MNPLFQAIDRLMTGVETRTYGDGTVATGPAPLPAQSPTQQDAQQSLLGMVEDYGQWLWDCGYMDSPTGETLVDDATERRKEIAAALEALLQHAYSEGRKDEREDLERIGALVDCTHCNGIGERPVFDTNMGPDAGDGGIQSCPDCKGTGYAINKVGA